MNGRETLFRVGDVVIYDNYGTYKGTITDIREHFKDIMYEIDNEYVVNEYDIRLGEI